MAPSVMRTPWWTSYFSLSPRRIEIVSSTGGSPTNTGWKRRARAASFSIFLRYSSSVVAPMQCSSPRASAGLSMFEASIAPSALPARCGEVAGVLLQRLLGLLGRRSIGRAALANGADRRVEVVRRDASLLEDLCRRPARERKRQQHVVDRDKLVAGLLG